MGSANLSQLLGHIATGLGRTGELLTVYDDAWALRCCNGSRRQGAE
ncbi:MAG: hypothetical protein U0936_01245 [Planctomycetaceae bacterium]